MNPRMPGGLVQTAHTDPMLTLLRALSEASAQLDGLLLAAIGPLCSGAGVAFGLLLVLEEERVLAAVVCEGLHAVTVEPDLLARLVTQGIVGYAASREAPVLLRDISVDPRWAPPALDQALPTHGTALAIPVGAPVRAVLVLVASDPTVFTHSSMAWLGEGMERLHSFLNTALEIDALRENLTRTQARHTLHSALGRMAVVDMRAPLQNIQLAFSVSSRLMQNALGPEQAAHAQHLIRLGQHSADHLADLSALMLAIAHLEQEREPLIRQPTALEPVIADALTATALLLETSGCALTVHVAPGLPELLLDASLIRRVLIYLIENALRRTPPGGLITVNVEPQTNGVVIRISDTGTEVRPDLQADVVSHTFDGLPPGGIQAANSVGLAFCRLALNAHGGTIWAEHNPSGGSVFAFTLPEQA